MLKRKRIIASAMLAMAVMAGVAKAQVMEKVPADAMVVVKVADLTATSGKVAKLLADFGVDAFAPQLKDPLAALKGELSIKDGLKESGDAALVVLPPKDAGGNEDKSIIILVPVSDYKAFIANFPGATTDGAVTETKMDKSPDPAFIADWGGYAAISPTKALIEKAPTKILKTAGITSKEAAKHDFLIYVNHSTLREELLPKLKEGREKTLTEIEDNLAENEKTKKYLPVAKVAFNKIADIGEAFLRDGEVTTIGISIVDTGVNVSTVSDFKPESYAGTSLASIKNSDGTLLTGLPETRYIAYGGIKSSPEAFSKIASDFADPILDELAKVDPENAKTVTSMTDGIKNVLKANKSSAFGMIFPGAFGGEEAAIQQIAVYDGGAKEIASMYEGTSKMVSDISQMIGGKVPMEATIEKKVKTIEGIDFDRVKISTKLPEGDPSAAQVESMLKMMYGPDGQNFTYGITGDKLVMFSGATDTTVTSFIQAIKASDTKLAKKDFIAATSSQLPKQRFGEFYWQLDETVNLVVGVAGQFGLPVQVQLPAELPPIGFTIATEGSAARFDVHIPSSTVQAIIAAGIQTFGQMRGGPRGAL